MHALVIPATKEVLGVKIEHSRGEEGPKDKSLLSLGSRSVLLQQTQENYREHASISARHVKKKRAEFVLKW